MEEENVLELKELLRRRKYAIYQKKPLKWVEDILEEPPKFYKWSLHEGYENHVWDGDKDPVLRLGRHLQTSNGLP